MSMTTRTLIRVAALSMAGTLVCGPASAQDVAIGEVVSAVNDYRSVNEVQIVSDFVELLSLPNVADNLDDMERNASHIIALLEQRGFTTRRLSAGGAPYVYAELASPGAVETVLIYAHFDGQPVQEENWAHPPFTPTLLDAPLGAGGSIVDPRSVDAYDPEWRLYARSAGDDKMPIIALIHALDALDANDIDLSVNLKLLLDGEEEQGSPSVGRILDANRDLLQSDLFLFCDGPMHPSRRAQLVFGVRGDMTVDITTYGPARPLHSGHYGNWAPNPVMQLTYLLTSMRDETGRILIDGYYDDVAPLTELERAAIAAMPDTTEALQDELSIHTPEGDGRRLEELIMLPALNARGIVAGGVGAKGRNVILSTATSSLDLRLVPGQTPARVRELVEAHLVEQGFLVVHETPDSETLRSHAKVAKVDWDANSYPAHRTALDNPVALRFTKLMRLIRPDLIVTPTSGGSLPLYEFASRLDTAIISLPMANHDNNQHAENENIRLQNLWDAIAVYATVLATYGAM
ncbi:MAG: M20/M25/M40 family metallo-hydrolase [Gammaproteobacteria bacterium]|nr:M20/M25/M40 family metallo-hydrolase [Gammaproteobacteria bacterium]